MSTAFAHLPIVTDGLILHIDAYNRKSYVSGGTTCNNLRLNTLSGGTLSGGTTFDGKSFVFDGIDGLIEVPHSTDFDFSTMDYFTLTSWVKFDTWESGTYAERILTKSSTALEPATSWEWAIRNSDKTMAFRTCLGICGVSGSRMEEGTTTLELNKWYYLVFTFDGTQPTGSKGRFYVNGNSDPVKTSGFAVGGSQINLSNVYDSGYSFKIGGLPTRNVDGSIPVVKIYNKVLTPSEVLQNYNALKGRFL